jgi:hypothetical protein
VLEYYFCHRVLTNIIARIKRCGSKTIPELIELKPDHAEMLTTIEGFRRNLSDYS